MQPPKHRVSLMLSIVIIIVGFIVTFDDVISAKLARGIIQFFTLGFRGNEIEVPAPEFMALAVSIAVATIVFCVPRLYSECRRYVARMPQLDPR